MCSSSRLRRRFLINGFSLPWEVHVSDLPSPCVLLSPVKRKWLQTLHYCAGTNSIEAAGGQATPVAHHSCLFSQQNCHGIFQFHPTPPSPNPALSYLRFLGKDKIRLLWISWLIRGDCRADSKFLDIQMINCSKVDFSYSCTDCFRFLLTKASRGRNHWPGFLNPRAFN